MAVLKPRNRLVYFRVSEDEFCQFTQLCEREGARSISDLARDAMHRLVVDANGGMNGETVSSRVRLLDKLIAEVSEQLQQLAVLWQHQSMPSMPATDGNVAQLKYGIASASERSGDRHHHEEVP